MTVTGQDRAGEMGGAETFVRSESGWLVRCAYLLTGERERALDLAQDTAIKVWRSWPRVEAADDPRAYVATIMTNTYRSGLRRRRLQEVPLQLLTARDEPPGESPSYEDGEAVVRALDRLPRRQRAAVVLRYWVDLETSDIAAALGCRPATVRSLLARATTRLRAELKE
ncbi:MAG: RNA polymerase sigma factor [Mycobacteriales bacterium]